MNLSPRRKAAVIIVVAFFALASLAIYTANPLSAHSLERRLAISAEEALYAVDAEGWVRMRIDGQTVTLAGQAPSRAARDEALNAVRRASWAGGAVAGGVTRVIDETRLAFQGEAVRLSADLSGARLVLTGFAPDAEAAEAVRERAERLFPGRAEVNLRIAPGSAAPGWDGAARLMLAELARLDHGGARLADGRIALTGLVSNAQTLDAVSAAFDNAPEGFNAGAVIRVDGGEYQGRVLDARLCELLIEAALGEGRVSFTPGRATLASGSAEALRRAGRVYETCEMNPLIVAVRAEGGEAPAEALALERAEAVIAAMSEAGPQRARFLAESAPSDAETAFRLMLQPAAPEAASETEAESGSDEGEGETAGDAPAQSDDISEPREG